MANMGDLRKRIYEIVEAHVEGDSVSRAFKLAIVGLIFLSIVSVVLETVPSLAAKYGRFFHLFETITVFIFTMEYAVRVWSCTADTRLTHPVRGRLRFVLTPLALIDLIAILPFYLPMFTTLDLRFVRALRLLRLSRILKIGRYSESLRILGSVIRNKREELAVTLFVALVMLVVSSSLMFYIENDAQPDTFTSIPAAMWWGVATLTTVGYGDIYPVTPLGKLLGAVSALMGIGMFALPAGILGSSFIEEMHRRHSAPKTCPHCGKTINN